MKAGECGMKTSFILRQRYNVFLNNNFFLFSRLRSPASVVCVFCHLFWSTCVCCCCCSTRHMSWWKSLTQHHTQQCLAWTQSPGLLPRHFISSFSAFFCFTHFNTLISYDKRRVCTSETQNISSIRQCSSSSLTFNNIHFIPFQLKCSFHRHRKKSSFISLRCFLMLRSLYSNTRRVLKRRKKNVLRILLLPESFSLKLIMLIMLSVNPTTVQRGERDERRDFSVLE